MITTDSELSGTRRAGVTGFSVPGHHGDDSALLLMVVQSGNLSLDIWSSGRCRMNKDRDMRESIPNFLNGVFSFVGAGYEKPTLLNGKLTYLVPPDKRTQLIYFARGMTR